MPIKLVDPTTGQEADFYTPAEFESTVTARANSAREDEKKKLYPDIDRYRNRVTQLEGELNELKSKGGSSADVETLRTQLQTLQTQIAESDAKTEKAVNAALDQANAMFQSALAKEKLSGHRAALIQAAQGKIIPDLVTGNTIEELNASAEKARQRYDEIYNQGLKEAEEKLKGAQTTTGAPGRGSSNAGSGSEETVVDADSLRGLTPEQWEQQKLEIKRKAFAATGLPMKVR